MTPISLALAFNLPTLLILLALALLIFGSRLPSLGKNLGKSIVSFKKGLKEGNAADDEDEADDDDEIDESPKKKRKQLAAEGSETVEKKREKQRVPADEDDDEA